MTNEHLQTVQSIYESFGRGDVDAILTHLTDDVDWATESVGDIAPWHGPHQGKAAVPHFFRELGNAVQVTEFTPLTFATNETDVLVVIRFGMTVIETGRSATMDLHHWWRFRGDKVCLYRGAEDTALTETLLSPAPIGSDPMVAQ